MEKVIKKFNLNDKSQKQADLDFWNEQTIKFKLEVLESLRRDAVKLGLYPEYKDGEQRLRRVLRIIKRQ